MKIKLEKDRIVSMEDICCKQFWTLLEKGILRFGEVYLNKGELCFQKFVLTEHVKDGDRLPLFMDAGGWTESICVNFCPNCGEKITFAS